jgi:antitoxin Xre/MbcA/ParS-like protein
MPKARNGGRRRTEAGTENAKTMSSASGFREEAAPFVASLLDAKGILAVDRVADAFRMSKSQLADTLGLTPETLYKPSRAHSPKTQARIREMLEIISFVEDWAGGKLQAMAWYRAQAIPEFGGRTAESLVKSGHASAVRKHLDRIAMGGFA